MRAEPTILHVDLDAFFAAVEQRDKPSLRGKPVVVGGVGGRGVVATASYEARTYGVHSAMSTREARARCPHAAYLSGRHHVYRQVSGLVMGALREMSPLVEPLSMDEAFVDLAAGDLAVDSPEEVTDAVTELGRELKSRVEEVTGGLTASVGIATSKLIAKIASDLDKPDGLVVVAPGTEADLIGPMPVRTIPGVGPATAERLRRVGVTTVEQLRALSSAELVRLVGQAHGTALHAMSRAEDPRRVVAEREAKSISIEDTYDVDLVERRLLEGLLTRQAEKIGERLRKARLSGRTVTVKVRLHDFTTHSRSLTLPSPTDQAATLARVARSLLGEVDTRDGVRLLGVGVSGLADWIQEDLFDLALLSGPEERPEEAHATPASDATDGEGELPEPAPAGTRWAPGMDVEHEEHGQGWVWGSGVGRVTVRFETAETGPGPVMTFPADDPALTATRPPEAD